MATGNHSIVTEFILAGLTEKPELQLLLFLFFLGVYVVTVMGNLGTITLIGLSSYLHTPMYYFLSSLSFIDLCYSTVIIPKMLVNFVTQKNIISYPECMTQLYFFIFFIISEGHILAVMAYDRYVAICKPLLYNVTMSYQVCSWLVVEVYMMGLIGATVHTGCMLRVVFCKDKIINHYFCDLSPLLELSSSTYINELVLLCLSAFNILAPTLAIFGSYVSIIASILRIHSTEGRSKAFSTCSSHILAVTIFCGSAAFMYLQPSNVSSMEQSKVSSVFYTTIVPMLNPLIYSLRNKDVKVVLNKLIEKRLLLYFNLMVRDNRSKSILYFHRPVSRKEAVKEKRITLHLKNHTKKSLKSIIPPVVKHNHWIFRSHRRVSKPAERIIDHRNHSSVTEFILSGLTELPEPQLPLFLLFRIYMVTVVGNMGMITLIGLSSYLHTPTCYFLSSLSFIDLCQSTVITPKMLVNFITEKIIISYPECMIQLYFFLIFAISECYMLAAMAYDCCVAICGALLYNVIMSSQVSSCLIFEVYIVGLVCASAHTGMLRVHFCKFDVINHYFCDLLPLLKLSCSSAYCNELLILAFGALNIFVPTLTILGSYAFIVASILHIRSTEGRSKAFSTCSSQIWAVTIFYGSAAFMYLQPSSVSSMDQGKVSSVFYTIIVPMLNTLIYSLRNKDVNVSRRKMLMKRILF
ncbi:LOW QUALITY PROTEIN: uncharacterized protein ACIGJ3_017030 [Trichechus inunguis]